MDDSQKDLTSRQRGAIWRSCPGHNGTEGGQAMNGSTKDLTSRARFELAILSRAEPSRAEPSRAEPSRAEPSRAEPSRAEPSRAEPSRAEPSRAEPSRAEPSRAEAMTAPRLREQCRPPSPPDRRPSRRGGHPSPSTASAAGRPAGLARLAGARRGLVRSVRALAAAALLALCGALALPATAQAQTVEALVSNLDVGRIGNWGASTDDHALQFTTGNSGRGYVLDSIRLSLWRVPRSGKTVTVSVWTSSGDRPDALHVRLTSPSSYSADANNTFRAPSGTTLGGNNRKYFVVVKSDDTSNGAGVWRTDSDDQEPSGTEWRIANDQLRQADSNTTWGSAETLSSIFQFEIKGYTGTRPEADTGNAASSVASNGSSLDLYFTKSLDSANPPPASAFEVIVNGFPVAIGRISVADRLLSLQQLSPNILQGETVEVKYTDPTSGDDASAIQDGGGTDANHFHVSVTNGSTITKPKLTAAAVSTDGSSIGLTFSEDLDHPTYTTTIRGAFTVTVDGTDTSVTNTTGGMASVTLSVSPTIGAGQTVVVSYDESAAGTEALGDSDGNKVADFTTASRGVPAVANNSDVDRSPPMLTGAVVTSSGVAIELAFDEDLDVPATIPAALKDAFTVTAAGTEVEISSLAKNGSSGLQINLSSAILKDQAVIVSYLKSAAGTNALDDDAGNEVVDFTTGSGGFPAVVNNATELSDDATLSELEVVDVDLSPAFNAGIEMYSATVLTSHLQVTFMATTNHASATVAYLDGDGMALEDVKPGTLGHQVDTAVGPNIVKVKVTAQDGTTEKTYTVTVTRDSPHARRGHGAGGRDVRRGPASTRLAVRHRDAVDRGGRGLHGHRQRRRPPDNGHRAGAHRRFSERHLVHSDLPGPGRRRELRQRRRRHQRPRGQRRQQIPIPSPPARTASRRPRIIRR